MPPCISEVTFFLTFSDDILGMIIFSSEIWDAVMGEGVLPRRSDKKLGIKPAFETPDK